MNKKNVLITGMSGRIGTALNKFLGNKYSFTGLNRNPIDGIKNVTADITDLESIIPHFRGQETVVHLAAALSTGVSIEDIIDRNIKGVYNVYEAARITGVKRVIFASSGNTIVGYTLDSPYREIESGQYHLVGENWDRITHLDPVRPNNPYGASKVWGEALGRYYSDYHSLSVLCIRFGWLPKEDRPNQEPRTYSVWTSHQDAARMVELCIDAEKEIRFDTFFCVSNNKWGYRDLNHPKDILNFEPKDRAEDYR